MNFHSSKACRVRSAWNCHRTGWRVGKTAVALLGVLLCFGPAASWSKAQAKTGTLYQRLGGYDAIAAVADDFMGRMASDPQLARFFGGSSADSRRRRRQLLVEQLCAASGGPCYYTGRSMKASHQGLGISEADWDITVKHLIQSLDQFKVPPKEKEELLNIVSGVKAEIVEAGKAAGRSM